MEDVSVASLAELVSCADCYAVVKSGDLHKHFEWHSRAVRDAVAASVEVVADVVEAVEGDHGPNPG